MSNLRINMHSIVSIKTAGALALCAVAAARADADAVFPPPDYTPQPSQYASPRAVKGGAIRAHGGSMPKSLNYLLDNNVFSAQVFGLMYESLLGSDDESGDHAPGLASKWSVSDDGRSFTFFIDPAARWSDGRPVSADDVRWTFDAIMSPGNLTGPHKVALETFVKTPPEILAPDAIRFTAAETHWRNLGAAGGFPVLPKHVFEGRDFNKINYEFPVVSGSYRRGEIRENISLKMERRADWWAAGRPQNRGMFNFDTIEFVFFADANNAFEAFRKGAFDFMPVYSARIWAMNTAGERFDKNWIVKKSVRNKRPAGFQGFAMNMRRAPYDDVRVRKALAYLLDRKTFNETMMFGAYFLHRSYFEDLYGDDAPCLNPFFEFAPAKAAALLAEAGWRADPATGMLVKDGKPLVLRFLSNGPTADRFLARYKNALSLVGIGLEIERKDWAAWARDMDAYNFEITWAAWSSGVKKDPESMWHSIQASAPGGNNITGFAAPEVDALIEKQKTEMSLAARNEICREIDGIITSQVPYILLWNADATRILWWNKFGVPDSIISKYGSADDALQYWWHDPDSAAALADAMKNGIAIPAP